MVSFWNNPAKIVSRNKRDQEERSDEEHVCDRNDKNVIDPLVSLFD